MRVIQFWGLIIRILRPRWRVTLMIGLMTLLVKSGPGDFEEYQELVRRAASIKKATNG